MCRSTRNDAFENDGSFRRGRAREIADRSQTPCDPRCAADGQSLGVVLSLNLWLEREANLPANPKLNSIWFWFSSSSAAGKRGRRSGEERYSRY